MKAQLLVVPGVVLMILVAGCSKKAGSQATPKDAVEKFVDGLLQFDKAKVTAVVTGNKQQLKAVSAFMDYLIAVRDFKKAITEAYGASGWAHFENEGGAKLSLNLAVSKDRLDSAEIKTNGNKATCTIPGEARAMNLLRKDGVWYVDAAAALDAGGVDLDKFIRMWTAMTELIRKKHGKIGQPGVTAQSLDMELGNELLSILTANR